jgi:glycosyltransferase involved in cell wall biosynthesis
MRRLRILWLSHFVPYPPKGGCFQRSYNLISRVGRHHDVHLIALRHKASTHPAAQIAMAKEELLRHCRTVEIVDISSATTPHGLVARGLKSIATATPFNVAVYESAAMREHIRALCSRVRFDVFHYDTIGLAQYLPDTGDGPTVMTHHGAESHMIHRRIRLERNVAKRAFFTFEWLALERYERAMCRRFDANVTMSDDDGRLLHAIAPDATFTTVANGVDIGYFTPAPATSDRSIVFAGRLDQYSNRDGILYFMNEAWPALSREFPDATIDILGHNPPEELRQIAARTPQVTVTGFVDDIRPYFQRATAAICPVRDGGGTRIKVLDALAQGKPLVSTSIGCEGIAVVPERDVLVADSAADFVRQLARVFRDPALRQRLAENGRRVTEERYSWDALAAQLVDIYERVVPAGRPEPAARINSN